MSPASSAQGQPSGRGAHTRGPSVSGQFHTDEPKISEESQSTIKDKNGVIRHPANDDFSDEDLHDDEETGLTTKERRRKQKKKRRNTLLDQRIARDNVTAEEKKEADQTVVRKLAVNGTLIGLWYLFSLGISLVSRIPAILGQPADKSVWPAVLTTETVQQVDVRQLPAQLPLSAFHHIGTYACAIYTGLSRPLFCTIIKATQCPEEYAGVP